MFAIIYVFTVFNISQNDSIKSCTWRFILHNIELGLKHVPLHTVHHSRICTVYIRSFTICIIRIPKNISLTLPFLVSYFAYVITAIYRSPLLYSANSDRDDGSSYNDSKYRYKMSDIVRDITPYNLE